MAEFAIRRITPVRFNEGYFFKTPVVDDDADFGAGAPAHLSAGEADVAGVNDTPSEDIAGFFTAGTGDYAWKEDTFGTVVPSVPIAPANQEFRGTLLGTFAASDVGSEYGLDTEEVDGEDIWVVDKENTGDDARVLVIAVDQEVEVGDTNVPCRFVVLPDHRQVIG